MGVMAKRQLFAQSLVASGCEWFLHRFGGWRGLLVLNYHRIGDSTGTPWDHDLWSARTEDFDWQLSYLKSHFDLISPRELELARKDRRGRHVMITFDDGYRDNYQFAFPSLKAHNVPATFFIATQFLDQPCISWWDEVAWMIRTTTREFLDGPRWLADPILIDHLDPQTTIRTLLRIYKCLPGDQTTDFLNWLGQETGCGRCPMKLATDMWLTWDMVREMRGAGMSFGAHTVHHPILSRIPVSEQLWEISESRRRIEHELGESIQIFSYPVGGAASCNEHTFECLRTAGFEWAFRFRTGFRAGAMTDPLQIPRMAVERYDSRTMFRAITTLPRMFD